MPHTLGVAVVGFGAIGREHASIYRDLSDCRLVAVADPVVSPQSLGPDWADVECAASLESVLNDDRIGAISLCTPDHVHYEDALRILRSGKHLLLEKPIATQPDEVRALVEMSETVDVVAMPGHTLRFESRYHWAWQQFSSGRIGDLVHGYVRRNNKVSVAARAGGRVSVAFFLGVHDVDALQWVTGQTVVAVQARESEVRDASGKQAAVVMGTMEMSGGGLVQLEAGWALPEDHPTELDSRLRLIGTTGELSVDNFDNGARISSDRYELPMPVGSPLYGRTQGPLREELAHFVRCCQRGAPPAISMREAAQAVNVVNALDRAVRSGQVEQVERL